VVTEIQLRSVFVANLKEHGMIFLRGYPYVKSDLSSFKLDFFLRQHRHAIKSRKRVPVVNDIRILCYGNAFCIYRSEVRMAWLHCHVHARRLRRLYVFSRPFRSICNTLIEFGVIVVVLRWLSSLRCPNCLHCDAVHALVINLSRASFGLLPVNN
jgi:hypothetical protein